MLSSATSRWARLNEISINLLKSVIENTLQPLEYLSEMVFTTEYESINVHGEEQRVTAYFSTEFLFFSSGFSSNFYLRRTVMRHPMDYFSVYEVLSATFCMNIFVIHLGLAPFFTTLNTGLRWVLCEGYVCPSILPAWICWSWMTGAFFLVVM